MKSAKNRSCIYGLLLLICESLAWGFTTISYTVGNLFCIAAFMLTAIAVFLYIRLFTADLSDCDKKQLSVVNIFVLVVAAILVITCGRQNSKKEILLALIFGLIWFGVSLYIEFKVKCIKNIKFKQLIRYKYLFLLSVILIVFSYEECGLQFKWDGLLYYIAANNLNLFSISSLAEYGHLSQMYSILVKLSSLIIGDVAIAMAINNIVVLIISVWSFYALVRTIIPGKSDIQYVLATAVYGMSPFMLGMVNYYSLDYYLICLLPATLLFAVKKQWIYHICMAIVFCFTKETAIVIYVFLCFGILIFDFIRIKNLKLIINKKYYYFMFFIGILWVGIYKILGMWSAGNGGFGLDKAYIIEKLKVLYVLNFNWLLCIVALAGIVYMACKHLLQINWFLPIVSMAVGFTFFSLLFVTVNHARYIDSGVLVIYICAMAAVLALPVNLLSNIALVGMAFIMLLSSYFTIDPITKMCFQNIEHVITTSYDGPGDNMIYNKQMLYMESAMEELYLDAVRQDYDIAMPAIVNSTYFFDGMQEVEGLKEGYRQRDLYVSEENGHRYVYPTSNTKRVTFFSVADEIITNERGIMYIYTDRWGSEIAGRIKNEKQIVDEYSVAKNGWTLKTVIYK